jgi:hypothetical protein
MLKEKLMWIVFMLSMKYAPEVAISENTKSKNVKAICRFS